MALETQTDVEQILQVQDSTGSLVPPASDGEAKAAFSGTLTAGTQDSVTVEVPDAAADLIILAQTEGSAEVRVPFDVTQRTYTTDGGKPVYEVVACLTGAGNTQEVVIEDLSGSDQAVALEVRLL